MKLESGLAAPSAAFMRFGEPTSSRERADDRKPCVADLPVDPLVASAVRPTPLEARGLVALAALPLPPV